MKKKISWWVIVTGAIVGLSAVLLTHFGNPANMGFCIACFLRDIAGSLGLHSAGKVQYVRPEIIGLVLGAFVMSVCTKEFRAKSGSAPALRFVLGAFVMIGAIAVGLVGFHLARQRPSSLLDKPIQLPTATRIDKQLVIGSSLFGIGWGLAGICPGPAVVTLSAGMAPALIFVISMLFGMMLYRWTFHA